MPVVTMSRQVWTGADEVANRLCDDLGLIAFDKRLMVRVASEIGLSENEIVDYSEEQYEARGFFEALFRRSRPVTEVSSWSGGRAAGFERQVQVLDEDRAVDLVRSAINAAYDRDNVLIVGRGSQVVLEDKPNALHVRVVSPFEHRVARLTRAQNCSAAQARRLIQERDRATAEYLRTFHHVDPDDASLYHLVVNTAKLGIDQCVALVKAGIQALSSPAAD